MPPPNQVSARLKIQLKLSITRLRHIQQKETALAKQQRRDIASLLDSSKDESARIRVENIIRQEINVELLEILELYCELLLARIGLLDQPRRECDPGLVEPVKSIIYAAGKTEVKELQVVRDILILKFGKEFAKDALENPEESVSPKVFKKLTVQPPAPELVQLYLEEIAKTYRIPWSGLPEEERIKMLERNNATETTTGGREDDGDDQPGSGGIAEAALQLPSLQTPTKVPVPPISVAPAAASPDNPKPGVQYQGNPISKPAPAVAAKRADGIPDFDELSKRFAALKR